MRGRSPLLLVVGAVVLLGVPAAAHGAGGFSLGVATGEVEARSAKVWAHNDKPGKVALKIASDRRMREIIGRGRFRAARANDGTVQVKINRGVRPATRYWFRFCRRAGCSDKGTFKTAPAGRKGRRISFAVSGDADPTSLPGESSPFFGNYKTFKAMRKESNDFNVFMGDTIYSDSGVHGPPALTAEEKWAKYRLGLEVRNLRKLRGSGPLYTHWDDHEFINDFSIPEDGEELYRAGVRAFTDYAPVGYTSKDGLYRKFRWGKNVEVSIFGDFRFGGLYFLLKHFQL
jgi:alkaline phosphatase D